MNTHELQAIAQMARATHDYNRGVLAMLGKAELATEYQAISDHVNLLVEQRNAATPDSGNLFDHLHLPPEADAIQTQIDATIERRESAWMPIQAMIDKAAKQLNG